jgi:hypothetical protein
VTDYMVAIFDSKDQVSKNQLESLEILRKYAKGHIVFVEAKSKTTLNQPQSLREVVVQVVAGLESHM